MKIIQYGLLLLMIQVYSHTIMAQETGPKPKPTKYNSGVIVNFRMLGPIRIHIQDFAVTDKYADTVSGSIDGRFLQLANLNAGVGLYRNFTKSLAMSGELMFGYGYLSKKVATQQQKAKDWSYSIRSDLYYHFYKSTMQLEPYLFVGIHGTYNMGNIYMSSPFGLGARYMFQKNQAMITAQVGYAIGLTNGIRNSVMYSTGFYFKLKSK